MSTTQNQRIYYREDLANHIGATLTLRRETVMKVLTSLEDIFKDLKEGDKIILTGTGTFEVKRRNARRYRHPATQKEGVTSAMNKLSFKQGKVLHRALNDISP